MNRSRMKGKIKPSLNLVFLKGFFPNAQTRAPYIDKSNIRNINVAASNIN